MLRQAHVWRWPHLCPPGCHRFCGITYSIEEGCFSTARLGFAFRTLCVDSSPCISVPVSCILSNSQFDDLCDQLASPDDISRKGLPAGRTHRRPQPAADLLSHADRAVNFGHTPVPAVSASTSQPASKAPPPAASPDASSPPPP